MPPIGNLFEVKNHNIMKRLVMGTSRRTTPTSLSILDNISVKTPCERADWEEMSPRIGGKHCSGCKKQVWDSLSLTRNQFRAIIAFQGNRACVRLTYGLNGKIQFKNAQCEARVVKLLYLLPTFAVSFLTFFYAPIGKVQLVELAKADEGVVTTELVKTPDTALRVPVMPPVPTTSAVMPKVTLPHNLAASSRYTVYGGPPIRDFSGSVWMYLEGTFGAMIMVLSAIVALVSCVVAFLRGKPNLYSVAGAAAIVSVLAFIVRSLVSIFFADI